MKSDTEMCRGVCKLKFAFAYIIFCIFALQQEAGRYPAYKEMVAEYGWLDKRRLLITKYDFAGLR